MITTASGRQWAKLRLSIVGLAFASISDGELETGKETRQAHHIQEQHPDDQAVQPGRKRPADMDNSVAIGKLILQGL